MMRWTKVNTGNGTISSLCTYTPVNGAFVYCAIEALTWEMWQPILEVRTEPVWIRVELTHSSI